MGHAYWHLLQSPIPVSDAVAPTIMSTMPPPFSEYTGGKLQATYLAQWQAIYGMRQAWFTFVAAIQAADAAYKAMAGQQAVAKATYDKCESDNSFFSFTHLLRHFAEIMACGASIGVAVATGGVGTPAAIGTCAAGAADIGKDFSNQISDEC